MKKQALKVIAVYDDGGKTIDRYTVYFNVVEGVVAFKRKKLYMCLGMDANPFHPQGFCQHCSGQLGRHNGKRVELKDLPADCQRAVKNDLSSND